MFNERRTHKRFEVREGRHALITPRWPHSTIVGDIVDISMAGLGLRHVSDWTFERGSCELDIACAAFHFYLRRLPMRVVSDSPVASHPSGGTTLRRLGLEFEALTSDMKHQLEAFIVEDAKGEVPSTVNPERGC